MADYYVDLGAGSDGTGTFASPWNSLASGATRSGITTADKIWVRRNLTQNITTGESIHVNMLLATIIGWPVAADDFYATRPVAAQATWDGDAVTRTTLSWAINATTAISAIQQTTTGLHARIYSLQILVDTGLLALTSNGLANTSAANCIVSLVNCYVRRSSTTPLVSSSNRVLGFMLGAVAVTLNSRSCVFELISNGYTTSNGKNTAFFTGVSTATLIDSGTGVHIATTFTTNDSNFYSWAISSNGTTTPTSNDFLLAGTFIGCSWVWTTHIKTDVVSLNLHGTNFSGTPTRTARLIDCTFTSVYAGSIDNNRLYFVGKRANNSTTDRDITIRGLKVVGFNIVDFATISHPVDVDSISADIVNVISPLVSINKLNTPTLNLNIVSAYSSTEIPPTFLIVKNINSSCAINRMIGTSVILSGIDSDPTSYKKIDDYGTVIVAAPNRTGGEVFSVQLLASPTYYFGAPGVISHFPGMDTIFAAVSNGVRTVTLFGYYKGFSVQTPTVENIFAEIDVLLAGGQTRLTSKQVVFSPAALTSDASVWNSISGGTPFKIVFTFTAAGDQNIAVRFGTSLSEAGAQVNFDPKPLVA